MGITKYIYVVGIGAPFEIGNNAALHKVQTKFKPIKCLPTKPIDETEKRGFSMYLFDYMPPNFMMQIPSGKFTTTHMEYTDSVEKVKVSWFKGVISSYNHVKSLEEHELIRIDKRTERGIPTVLKDMEKHKNKYPHLWI